MNISNESVEAAREAHAKGWDVHVQSGKDETGRPTLRYVIYTNWVPDPRASAIKSQS